MSDVEASRSMEELFDNVDKNFVIDATLIEHHTQEGTPSTCSKLGTFAWLQEFSVKDTSSDPFAEGEQRPFPGSIATLEFPRSDKNLFLFKKECQFILQHKSVLCESENVIQYIGLTKLTTATGQFPHLVLEYVRWSLDEYIDQNKQNVDELSYDDKVRLALNIANGLKALHAANIVHCAVFAENILLVGDAPHLAKIANFSVACLVGGEEYPDSNDPQRCKMPPGARVGALKTKYDMYDYANLLVHIETLDRPTPQKSLVDTMQKKGVLHWVAYQKILLCDNLTCYISADKACSALGQDITVRRNRRESIPSPVGSPWQSDGCSIPSVRVPNSIRRSTSAIDRASGQQAEGIPINQKNPLGEGDPSEEITDVPSQSKKATFLPTKESTSCYPYSANEETSDQHRPNEQPNEQCTDVPPVSLDTNVQPGSQTENATDERQQTSILEKVRSWILNWLRSRQTDFSDRALY